MKEFYTKELLKDSIGILEPYHDIYITWSSKSLRS